MVLLPASGTTSLLDFLAQRVLGLLTRNNNGIFPINRAFESITGDAISSHGTREMPVWGKQYRMDAADYYMDVPYDPDAYTRLRVLALIEYLSRIQIR